MLFLRRDPDLKRCAGVSLQKSPRLNLLLKLNTHPQIRNDSFIFIKTKTNADKFLSTVSLRLASTVVFRRTISVLHQHRQLSSAAKFVVRTGGFPDQFLKFARSMSEVVIKSEMDGAEKCPAAEDGADIAPKKPKLEEEVVDLGPSQVPETGVGCQCSIEAKMEPDDTSILVNLTFPDKEYDGELEDTANMVSTTQKISGLSPANKFFLGDEVSRFLSGVKLLELYLYGLNVQNENIEPICTKIIY